MLSETKCSESFSIPKEITFLSYKQLEVVLLENNSISVRYLFFGSHLNMKMFGFTIELYAKTHLLSKCYGNDSVLTITERMFTITKRNNFLLLRSTDERASCLSL